jgi:hypothetical protein
MDIKSQIEIGGATANAIKETTQPIINAVIEIFSPITELFGWGGDTIRVYRERTALKCVARTKEIATKAGIKLQAPPTKFIAQFIENCSLEDEDDETLIEWWARLLVDAGTDYNTKHIFHANALKQVSGSELELLEVLVRNGPGSYRLEHANDAEFKFDFNFPGEKLSLSDNLTSRDLRKSLRTIKEEFNYPGLLILEIFVDDEKSRQHQDFHPDYDDDELAQWQMLQSLQLVRLNYRRFVSGSVEYRVRLAVITELGAQFYFACHEKDFHNRISNRVRFKRLSKVSASKEQ